MDVAVLIVTWGSPEWQELARSRARPSALAQTDAVLLFHEPDGNAAQTRNHAAEHVAEHYPECEWFCFLDADDELAPGYLDAMAAAHPKGDLCGLLVPAVQYMDAHGSPAGAPGIPAWGRDIYEVNCAVIGTLVSRAMFTCAQGFTPWPIYEDWELWLRCLEEGAFLVPVPDAVYVAHQRPGSRNTQPDSLSTYRRIRALHASR